MDVATSFVLALIIGSLFSWVSYLIIIPLARKIADFSFPPWGEALWKLAVVAVAVNAVTLSVGLANGFLGWIASGIVFFALLYKWFDVDLWGAIVVVVVSLFVRMLLGGMILSMLGPLS